MALEYLENGQEARHVGPHAQAVQATQAEGQQHHPEPAENEQHGHRIRVVQVADAELSLAEAQADAQTDTQLAGFAAEALQPGQQQAESSENAQADQRVAGGPETQAGAAGTEAGEQQHAQHAEAMQRIGLSGLKGASRGPEKTTVSGEQAEHQRQGTTQPGDHGRPPGRRAGMPGETVANQVLHALFSSDRARTARHFPRHFRSVAVRHAGDEVDHPHERAIQGPTRFRRVVAE